MRVERKRHPNTRRAGGAPGKGLQEGRRVLQAPVRTCGAGNRHGSILTIINWHSAHFYHWEYPCLYALTGSLEGREQSSQGQGFVTETGEDEVLQIYYERPNNAPIRALALQFLSCPPTGAGTVFWVTLTIRAPPFPGGLDLVWAQRAWRHKRPLMRTQMTTTVP